MNDIKFATVAPGKGTLYINGVEVPWVLSLVPDLFGRDQLAQVTIVLAVKSFELTSAPE